MCRIGLVCPVYVGYLDGAVDCLRLGLGDTTDRGDSDGEMGDNLPAVDLGTGESILFAQSFILL